MNTRLYKAEDYPVIADWWHRHNQPPVPVHILPKCGVVVCGEDGVPIAATWLYQDNSVGVAWMAWLVTDGKTTPFTVDKAVLMLVEAASTVARELNYGLLFTMTDRPGLGKWFERNGWARNHTGMTQYFKRLNA